MRKMKSPRLSYRQFLGNPVWYAATVTILAVLTLNIRFLWWLASAVAVVWGTWLVWQLFTRDKAETGTDQLRGYLDQTLAYQVQIEEVLKATSNGSNRAHRLHLAAQINLWTEAIQRLAQHVTSLRQDNLIRQDMTTVPKAIELLEAQLAAEVDP